ISFAMVQLPARISIEYGRVLSRIRIARLMGTYIKVFCIGPIGHTENNSRKPPLLGKAYIGFNDPVSNFSILENHDSFLEQQALFTKECFPDGQATQGIPFFRIGWDINCLRGCRVSYCQYEPRC